MIKKADVEIPITYFPGWEVYSNGQKISQEDPSKHGLIRVRLPEGTYKIQLNFSNTPVRAIGNIISLLSIFVVVALLCTKKWLVKDA